MRLWSLHPRYLDRQGLLALWREGLLAQKVLSGQTRGCRNHPQLDRFRATPEPGAAIAAYLTAVASEAASRGYRFDGTKIAVTASAASMNVTAGQLAFEREHLLAKLQLRDPARAGEFTGVAEPLPHPLFVVVPGPVAAWERGVL